MSLIQPILLFALGAASVIIVEVAYLYTCIDIRRVASCYLIHSLEQSE